MDLSKCVNYFVMDGKKYYTGTGFKVKEYGNIVDAVFVCTYYASHTYIVYKIPNGRRFVPVSMFPRDFVCFTNTVDNETQMPQTKHMKDSDINGLPLGWLWYIFLMAISIIFKDAIGLWIFISVVFFSWRAKKIKEEGTYIEW